LKLNAAIAPSSANVSAGKAGKNRLFIKQAFEKMEISNCAESRAEDTKG